MRQSSLCFAVLFLLAAALSCDPASTEQGGGTAATGGPIVVVTLEGWWHESVGDPLPETLRQTGRVVEDAMTSSTQLRAAAASALSGSSPVGLGVREDLLTRLGEEAPYLPDMLREAGWTTGAFVANPLLGFGSGFERGFDVYDADDAAMMGPERHSPPSRPADVPVSNALSWLRENNSSRPAFAWVHLVGVQLRPLPGDQATPEPAARASALAAALERLERELFEASPEATLIVAGLHGRIDPEDARHNVFFLDPTVLRIPFAYRGREVVESEAAWLPDIAALVFARAGVIRPLDDGVFPRTAETARTAFVWAGARDFGWPVEAAILAGGVLTVGNDRTSEREHWTWADGAQASPSGDPFRSLAERDDWKTRPRPERVPEEIAERLRKAEVAFPDVPERPEPSDRATRQSTVQSLIDGRRAALARLGPKAVESFLAARSSDTANVGALVEAGEALVLVGTPRRARRHLQQALSEDPWRADAWHWLAHCHFLLDARGQAEATLMLSDYLAPGNADVLYDLACARALEGDFDGSGAYLRRAWEVGFRNVEYIQRDPDLAAFRADPRFARLMRELTR